MTKEKIIGTLLLIIGVVAFIDCLTPLDLFAYHVRPFLFPAFAIASGWLVLHGPAPLHRKAHHSHILGVAALMIVAAILFAYLHVHRHHQ